MRKRLLCALPAFFIASTGSLIAAPIEYEFLGTGSGTLGATAFSGTFQVDVVGDTFGITNSGFLFSNPGSGSFTAGALSAALDTGAQVNLNTDPAFPRIGFGQSQPGPTFFVEEATQNSVFASYDLASPFPLTSGTVSFSPQTYFTNQGDLSFTNISSLSFEAISPVPLPTSAPMFGTALVVLGAVGCGMKRKKAATAA